MPQYFGYSSLAHRPSYEGGSTVRSMFDSLARNPYKAVHMGKQSVHAVRHVGESLVVAGALGALYAKRSAGLDMGKIPIDGLIALLGVGGSIAAAGTDLATDSLSVGASALSIYTFRTVNDLLAAKAGGPTIKKGAVKSATVHGEVGADIGEDPLIAAAKQL